MYTTNDIVVASARLAGIVAPHEPISDEDMQDMIQTYNMFVDAWGASSITARASTEERFNLVGGQREYSWGVGAPDFDSVRPLRVVAAGIIYPNNSENFIYPLDCDTTVQQYFTFTDREQSTGALPTNLIYDATLPYGTVSIYPVPNMAYTLIVRSLKPVADSTGDSAIINLEATYFEYIKFNLAIRYALEWGREVKTEIKELAKQSKRDLLRLCSQKTFISTTYPRRNFGGFNIWTAGNFSGG